MTSRPVLGNPSRRRSNENTRIARSPTAARATATGPRSRPTPTSTRRERGDCLVCRARRTERQRGRNLDSRSIWRRTGSIPQGVPVVSACWPLNVAGYADLRAACTLQNVYATILRRRGGMARPPIVVSGNHSVPVSARSRGIPGNGCRGRQSVRATSGTVST